MAMAPERIGIGIHRHFTSAGTDPFDTVRWERRDARISNYLTGAVAFEQLGVEVPSGWSVNATNILAQKYFRGTLGSDEREWSLKQVTRRVVDTITAWGRKDGYFVDDDEAEAFRDELSYLIIHQRAAFNSPVWFNIGVKGVPQQASACFILSVDDSMHSILNWYVEEGTIFKGGSGSGINLSRIRSSKEGLRGGGTASGPVSFMRGADASAGTIKCLHEDTPIVTTQGVRPIRAVEVGSLVPTRSGLRRVLARHDNGVRPLVRVAAKTGEKVLCTPEHRFWVRRAGGVEGWSEAGHIQPGDSMLLDVSGVDAGTPQRLMHPVDGHHNEIPRDLPTVLDQSMALWLGWLAGDGSITRTPSANFIAVQLGDDDAELVERYRAIVQTLFGDVNLFANRHHDKPDASSSVRFCSTRVIRFLELNGLLKGTADRVPDLVAASPAAERAAFLAGLFEADGHIGNGYVWLSTVSDELATGAQRLLHSLGIPTWRGRIDDRTTALGVRPVHTLRVVGGEGTRRFAKLVGFVSERKSRLLEEAMARRDGSRYETQWVLPHAVADLDQLWARSDGPLRRALAPYCRYAAPRSLSLLRARALYERFPSQLEGSVVERFAAGNEYWTPVSVEAAGSGPTFDLTVEDAHEYFVHNLVTHNSGGKTRRAAKMVILNADHPDIEDFIWCKAVEERKARALRDAGFDMDLDGKDSHSIQYQNANNSVRVTDEFMEAVLDDADWHLKSVTTGETLQTVKARALFRQIAKASWECADPGMQFDSTINRWHTAPKTGRINASNPCSEYMHLDDSACNLASLNLLTFLEEDSSFDVEGFKAATEVMFTAQEILVGNADYPTEAIGDTSRRFRQLGIGYANLGALLMAQGVPYDSDEGRAWAATITALLTGHSYATSARTAARMGPFAGYTDNRDAMLNVLRMHRDEVAVIDEELVPPELLSAAQESWDAAVEVGEQYGVRNSQASVLAPTGCLVGGSLIPTERGLVRLRSLGDPDGARWQELGVAVGTDEGPREAGTFYVNGAEAVVTVSTGRGYRIQGTPTHRIKIVDRTTGEWHWKRFAEIAPGDLVPLALDQLIGEPQTVALPPLPEAYWTGEHHASVTRTMTAALAELVGYFMGDGSLHSRGLRFCVTAGDFDVVERLLQLGKETFGLIGHVTPKRGYSEVRFDSVRLALWWEACGFAKHLPTEAHAGKGYAAHVPDAVLHANDRIVYSAFIRGLFEADGDTSAGYPTLKNTSVAMVRDVQGLLLALGYPTTLSVRERSKATSWGTAPLASLRLLNSSYSARWLDDIGFMSGRKNAAVRVPLTGEDAQQAARHDYVPVTRAMVDRLAPLNDRLRRVLLMAVKRERVSRRVATELYQRTGDAELGHLLSFFYDRVERADLGDDEWTYDLSVPANVTYVANGFVSHNTIGLLMDCDTTGIEPDLGLVKTKKLVGGGTMSIVNQTVPRALRNLGYAQGEVDAIIAHIDEHKSILGAPALKAEHLPVFACSMGDNTIHYRGHVRMMGAVQPFISGAISKCVTGDTLLSTAEGLVRIASLYRGEQPDSYRSDVREVASLTGPQKTDAFYYGGVRPVTSVVLRSGHRVTGTANHRLLVSGRDGVEWRRLDEIGVGEYVATQYGDDLWSVLPARLDHVFDQMSSVTPDGDDDAATISRSPAPTDWAHSPAEMSGDLAFLLGAYAAAGRIPGGGWAVHISCDVQEVLDRLAAAVDRVFGITASIRQPGGGLAGARLEFRSQTIVELLDGLGIGQCAIHKRIPDAVLRSPREMVLAYLQGLWLAADVTMCGTAKWALSSESPGLLDDLQAVLTNLGIVHERATRYRKTDGRPYDEIFAVGEHAHNLLTMVPFVNPHKAAFAQALHGLGRHPNCNGADVVPGISPYELYRVVPRSLRSDFSYLSDPRAMCVSRRSLEQVASVAGSRLPQWLRTVLDDNLHFSPVESVGYAGTQEVFDLSVPTTQAFVGNGIVNHNTVNMPEEATIDEVEQLHIEAWQLGLKAVAVYRDNCKVGQPLATTKKEVADPAMSEAEAHDAELALKVAELEKALQRQTVVVKQPVRERLPRKRRSMTFKFRVADCEGYVTVGEYDDGRPGEVFMQVSKQGSTLAGIMDAFAVAVSLGLQHGVPLATYVKKYTNMRFEPAGMTDDRELRIASSLVDYIFRRLAVDYLTYDERADLGILTTDERLQPTLPGVEEVTTPSSSVVEELTDDGPSTTGRPPGAPGSSRSATGSSAAAAPSREPTTSPRPLDAPYCYQCGVQMQRAGSCFACPSCGTTSGCS